MKVTINGQDLMLFALSMADVLNNARRRTISGQSFVLLEEASAVNAIESLYRIMRGDNTNEEEKPDAGT